MNHLKDTSCSSSQFNYSSSNKFYLSSSRSSLFHLHRCLLFVLVIISINSLFCAPKDGDHQPLLAPTLSPSTKPGTAISFQTVLPIFQKRCGSCHNPTGLADWTNESKAREFANNGRLGNRLIDQKNMPPPGSAQFSEITDNERNTIGQWIASVKSEGPSSNTPPAANSNPSPINTSPANNSISPSALPSSASSCVGCHGTNGISINPIYPHLAGQNATYLENQIKQFKDNTRSNAIMNSLVQSLTDKDIKEIADYFSAQPSFSAPLNGTPAVSSPIENSTAEMTSNNTKLLLKGAELSSKCVNCHATGNPPQPLAGFPSLAGQRKEYIVKQLEDFAKGQRKSQMMSAQMLESSGVTTPEDREALGLYFESMLVQKPQ